MIVDSLADQLKQRGYEVDTVKIPLRSAWYELLEQYVALRCLDLTEAAGKPIERLITIRYPSYALPHPNKVNWFIHHHRTAYDLWGTPYQDIPNTPEGLNVRRMIIQADTRYIREAVHTYTNSKVVAGRLKKFNNIDADGVVYPPLPDAKSFYCDTSGDYFLYTARLTPIKRQTLAIEAMQYVRSPFRLVLAGAADAPNYENTLKSLAEASGVADKVHFTGWIDEAEKARLTANALAALYIPYDEDSYGYSTLEAFHSRKAVITCTDSGGTDEIIENAVNGYIVASDAQNLAEAMERLWRNRSRAIEMGQAAFATLAKHRIDWDHVIECMVN